MLIVDTALISDYTAWTQLSWSVLRCLFLGQQWETKSLLLKYEFYKPVRTGELLE